MAASRLVEDPFAPAGYVEEDQTTPRGGIDELLGRGVPCRCGVAGSTELNLAGRAEHNELWRTRSGAPGDFPSGPAALHAPDRERNPAMGPKGGRDRNAHHVSGAQVHADGHIQEPWWLGRRDHGVNTLPVAGKAGTLLLIQDINHDGSVDPTGQVEHAQFLPAGD